MPADTPDQQITYPVGTDAADNPTAFLDMLADVQPLLVRQYTDVADRTARMLSLGESDVSALSTENRVDIYNGANHVSLAARSHNNFLLRTTDAAAINNSIALVSDATLTAPLVPTGTATYLFKCVVIYDSSQAADIRFAFAAPAGTLVWGGIALGTSATGVTGDMKNSVLTASGASDTWGGASLLTRQLWIAHGYLSTAVAGNLVLQYAQGTADPTNTVVRQGSWLRVTRYS